jgi:SAM-dependent methyltransferase
MSWFEDWFNSPYYDKLYHNHNEAEAKSFINILMEYLKPAPNNKIADIPCGKGRYSKYLSGFGLDVYGFDLSERNITEASKYAGDKLHFYTHDMRQPFYINYFDFIFNFFTSFGYFDSDRMDIRVLRNFHAALKPGGRLVIDFFNADYVIENLKVFETIDAEGAIFTIKKEFDGRSIIKRIDIADKGQAYHYIEKVRAYKMNNFEKMLAESGLKLVETFGDYRLSKFDKQNSPRLILIAEKN